MEAKDTVGRFSHIPNVPYHPITYRRKELQAQAEASFKAGVKEVVESVNAELTDSDSRNMWYLNKKFWQAKLKEWGIK